LSITNDQRLDQLAESAARKAPKHSTQLMMHSLKETAAAGGPTSESIADFIVFKLCQMGTSDQAFNIANIDIYTNILLLDSQSTIHLISNPALLTFEIAQQRWRSIVTPALHTQTELVTCRSLVRTTHSTILAGSLMWSPAPTLADVMKSPTTTATASALRALGHQTRPPDDY